MEPKFKAWDKSEKKMLRVNAIDFKNREFLEVECDESVSVITIPKGKFPEQFILMQYTDIMDEKRTEEYPEGQRVCVGDKYTCSIDGCKQEGYLVVEDLRSFYKGLDTNERYMRIDADSIEVIGHIYENQT